MRILFVEDNDDLREIIDESLRELGFDVVACASGDRAERLFAERAFDVLLTDVSMPGVSGLELARRLRAVRPDLWVVFLSGYALDDLAAWGTRVRCLLKPFEIDRLERLLKEIGASQSPA